MTASYIERRGFFVLVDTARAPDADAVDIRGMAAEVGQIRFAPDMVKRHNHRRIYNSDIEMARAAGDALVEYERERCVYELMRYALRARGPEGNPNYAAVPVGQVETLRQALRGVADALDAEAVELAQAVALAAVRKDWGALARLLVRVSKTKDRTNAD